MINLLISLFMEWTEKCIASLVSGARGEFLKGRERERERQGYYREGRRPEVGR